MPGRLIRIGLGRRALWVVPALCAAVVTGYLAWGAWVSAANGQWLYRSEAWWRVWLRPGNVQAPLLLVALGLVALLCYWWPRRLQQQVVLTIVVVMVVIGAILATAALAPCRGPQSYTAVTGWVLDLYVGNPPSFPLNGCTQPALAFQLGSPVCLLATLTGALTAAAVLWRQPVDRLRARMLRDAVIFTGLNPMSLPFLEQLVRSGRAASVVVIEPDASHPLLGQARGTGARVMIGQPAQPRVLLPIIAGGRGHTLRRLYALQEDVGENEAVLAAARSVLRRYRPDPERQPHLVARIDDPRHADHWRGAHIGTSPGWLEDALSALESTSSALANQVQRTGAERLLLCGDSTLALAILREFARRAWEQRELGEASEIGHAVRPGLPGPDGADREWPYSRPLQQVVLVDQRAEDLLREHQATSPASITQALPAVSAAAGAWQDTLLGMLDAMTPAVAALTAVVVADGPSEDGLHEAGRAARLHPGIPVFVLIADGTGTTGTIFDQLQPYRRSLLVGGQVPEDVWTRVARHWHECFRLRHPPVPGEERTRTRRPWVELDDFVRQDNILQLRSIMSTVAERGRQWLPERAVAPGSFIELTGADLEAIARTEHTRWYQRRVTAGWKTTAGDGAGPGRPGGAMVNTKVVPWTALAPGDRAAAVESLRLQLAQLEDVGFIPVVPPGGPGGAAAFQRVGAVRGRQLHARRRRARAPGQELSGAPGGRRVSGDLGGEGPGRDAGFLARHGPLDAPYRRRPGVYYAWQVTDQQVLRTLRGLAVAQPGDWVVEGASGERWPVADAEFQRTYQVVAED